MDEIHIRWQKKECQKKIYLFVFLHFKQVGDNKFMKRRCRLAEEKKALNLSILNLSSYILCSFFLFILERQDQLVAGYQLNTRMKTKSDLKMFFIYNVDGVGFLNKLIGIFSTPIFFVRMERRKKRNVCIFIRSWIYKDEAPTRKKNVLFYLCYTLCASVCTGKGECLMKICFPVFFLRHA